MNTPAKNNASDVLPLTSAVYCGQLRHRRRVTPAHKFHYAMRLFLVDLDELPTLIANTKFWSMRKGFASFDRENFVPSASPDIKSAVIDIVQQQTGARFSGKVFMLAAPKVAGIGFNPLTLYYCFADSNLRYIVAEVRNTPWMERHCYVLDMTLAESLTHDKAFHVSPFMDMHQKYHWTLPVPSEDLHVVIRNVQNDCVSFTATLSLKRVKSLTAEVLDRELISHWPQALKTVIGIYWQAVKLLIKGARFYAHPKNGESADIPNTAKEKHT